MGTFVLTDAKSYWGGADLTAYSKSVEVSHSFADLDNTTYGSGGWKSRRSGLRDTSVKLSGPWDVADGTAGQPAGSRPDDATWLSLGTTIPITEVPTAGTSVGDLAYLTAALHTERTGPGGAVGELINYEAAAQGTWPLVRGVILQPAATARTTTGVGTAVNIGAVPAGSRLWVCLHVLAVSGTGTPTLTVKIDSDDNSGMTSATTQATFTAATAIGGQTASVLGPITDAYWRASWTIAGTGPSFSFVVAAGIAAQ